MSRDQIVALMQRVDHEFVPPLSGKIDIETYVDKIVGNALIFEILDRGMFAGFIALYCNNTASKAAYITMVAIDEAARGRGFAATLVRTAIEHSQRAGFTKLSLEAFKTNTAAVNLYKKLGFVVARETDEAFILEIAL